MADNLKVSAIFFKINFSIICKVFKIAPPPAPHHKQWKLKSIQQFQYHNYF